MDHQEAVACGGYAAVAVARDDLEQQQLLQQQRQELASVVVADPVNVSSSRGELVAAMQQ